MFNKKFVGPQQVKPPTEPELPEPEGYQSAGWLPPSMVYAKQLAKKRQSPTPTIQPIQPLPEWREGYMPHPGLWRKNSPSVANGWFTDDQKNDYLINAQAPWLDPDESVDSGILAAHLVQQFKDFVLG